MGFAQREQALRLRLQGVDSWLGHRLPSVDAVLVAARADLRALRRVSGAHGVGQRRVQVKREPVQLGRGSPPFLCLAEPGLGLASRIEQFHPPRRERHISLVHLLR